MCWGGWHKEALKCFLSHFGMSVLLSLLSIIGIAGIITLFRNLESNLKNGINAKVTKIGNRNSETIGYIATYIVPFLANDFSTWFESSIFIVIMVLIYTIYTNSNMILINPILNIKYSLLDVEYMVVGDKSGSSYDALIITDNKDFKENVNYQLYQIGFKLYYGKKDIKVKKFSKLDEVLDKIKITKEEDVKLHFITRILKEGVGKREKTLDKYVFKVYQIDVDDAEVPI